MSALDACQPAGNGPNSSEVVVLVLGVPAGIEVREVGVVLLELTLESTSSTWCRSPTCGWGLWGIGVLK